MLRSAKGSTPFRNASGSTSGSGASGSTSSVFKSSSNGQTNSPAENGMHPNLGLHSAAATGNVGLVKFALDNGQPHTSVLNGLLPLHAACSGGSEPVVRLLITYGADVNATRAKMAKGSGGSGTGTGAEGSTPLHFASANGHLSIVRLLLENGARPTARDRDRQTPLSLASNQGHAACASLLKSWIGAYGPNGLAKPLTGSSSRSMQDPSSPLRGQRSFESLSSAAAGVKASLRSHRKQALAKVNSNPNLKSIASSNSYYNPPPFLPPPLPNSGRTISETASTSSTPPQSLSSVPNSLTQDYKRRPSLPSIFEKAAHPSSTILSQTSQPESIEELDGDAKKPPISPSRPTHRLLGKRSMTGLRSIPNLEEATPLPTMDSKYISQVYGSKKEDNKLTNLSIPATSRTRSGSVGILGQPSSSLSRSDLASMSMASSPTSSTDYYETSPSLRQNSTPSHSYRPRKSSNLSVTTSNPSPLIAQGGTSSGQDSLSVEQGRKRSQSTTCVPRQITPASELESFRKLSLSQQGTASSRRQNESQSDDTKEFLQSPHTTEKEKSNTPPRYRSHRSPLNSSKLLVDEMESRNPSSPSLGLRQLHSQRSSSSLISSTSSSNTNPRATRGNSFTYGAVDEVETEPRVNVDQINGARMHGSISHGEGAARKISNSSLRSFGAGLSAQEQAQAILRTAEERTSPSGDVPAISLTQMLAAYGEALALERKGLSPSYSPNHIRKQGSIASLASNKLPSVTEVPVPTLNTDGMARPVHRHQPNTLTPVSTPPESPQMTRSRAESSSTSFSRSPPSNRQQKGKMMTDTAGTTLSPPLLMPQSASPMLTTSPKQAFNSRQLESAGSTEVPGVTIKGTSPPSIDTLSHRHSPSLPADLSQLAGQAPSSPETTPRSKQRQSQHRPSLSDPHNSMDYAVTKRPEPPSPLSFSKSSTPQTPELQQTPSFNTATENEARTPLSDYDLSPDLMSASQSQILEAPNSGRSEKASQVTGGKRKGTVKAFLSGIKNNVVMR